jgi:dipeptidyl aminopeptidase/acylaminoacyl peptidase
MLTHAGIGLGELNADGDALYWVESRPLENGRSVIVRRDVRGDMRDVSPDGFDSRTRAHEYGGGAYAARDAVVVSSSFDDQRVYRLDAAGPVPITPEPEVPAGDRYADFVFHGDHVVCVRERHHPDGQPTNELVILPLDGSAPPRLLVDGHDFVASPRVSPDGTRLAWLAWDHPNMPWDGTELWTARLTTTGVADTRLVAGGSDESIFQPEFSPDGRLHFISDRTGWWNLYRLEDDGTVTALWPREAEFGYPQWLFGFARYRFLGDGSIVAVVSEGGSSRLATITPDTRRDIELDRTDISPTLAWADGRVWLIASGPTEPQAVIGVTPGDWSTEVVRRSLAVDVDEHVISQPEALTFPTSNDAEAHAFFYPPTNPEFQAPEGELPPLVVWSHGGPTSATTPGFNLGIQFWTSRGVAIVDVNYRGSTGYGRTYRNALRDGWGITDTADCIAAARFLAEAGRVDPERMAIRGGSAGGYTTLCALTFHDVFATGASYFGVADCEALAIETHKFESRYLDRLIGPYPEAADRYRERSPIHHTDQLSAPMILFQGLDDQVVPPAQAEAMVAALEAKGIPHAYLDFAGEGHGFRRADTIERAAEAELGFYGSVFHFTPAGPIDPVEIGNLTERDWSA